MAKDFDTSSDMIPEVGNEVSRDAGADCGGDIAGDDGVDLNADSASGADSVAAKATMMSYDATLPEDYTADAGVRPPDSAIYTEAPAPVPIEQPGWTYTMGDGDPAPDNRGIENYPETDYGDSPPDPPE